MAEFFCVVVSYVGRGLTMGRSPPKESYQNGEIRILISEVNSEWEQVRGPNPWNVQRQF